MDIIEMDAASNRGIDDIKDLIEHTKYKPSSARYKIFIIDEVHMLTPPAFNALLKTLEEPPAYIKFILATTDPLKLPATILSRTQHFRFKKIPPKLVLQHLEHILNKEGIDYEKEALEIIARSGAGSLRDSLTLLDQAIVYSRNYVNLETVTGMLGIIEPNLLEHLLDNVMKKDQEEILAFIKLAADYETEMIIDEITLLLKSLLLSRNPKIPPMTIERFFRILSDSKSLLNLGGDGEFILSLTLFKMMEALEIKDIDLMIKALEKELKGAKIPDIVISPAPAAVKTNEVITISEKDIEPSSLLKKKQLRDSQSKEEPSAETVSPRESPSATPKSEAPEKVVHIETKTAPSTDTHPNYRQVFEALTNKIYDRDYDLGSCFERNIHFKSFEGGALSWESEAQGEDKKTLITHWSLIKMFVQDLFGIETKIVNIPRGVPTEKRTAKKKVDDTQQHSSCDTDSGSMIEAVEMKSSCMMPEAGDVEAAKEKEASNILEETMIKEVLNLFDPKKVRVKKKV